MKRTWGLVLLVTVLAHLAAGAEPDNKAAVKPAPGLSAALLEQWNEIGRKLIAMAEDFPEDKYDFKPTAAVQSFAERLIHAAAANYFFTNLAEGKKPPAEEDPPRAQFKNKVAIVAYVKKSFADGAAAIKAKGDRGISEAVLDPFGQDVPDRAGRSQIRLADLADNLIEHSGEVYGQLTVYYRWPAWSLPSRGPKQAPRKLSRRFSAERSAPITSGRLKPTGTMRQAV